MAYRVARVPGDPRFLVIHPIRGIGTHLVFGLAGAGASIGAVLALQNPMAGAVVILASSAFAGWVGTEAWVTRVEIIRDEREGRLVVRSRVLGDKREIFVPLEDVRDVVLETNDAGLVRPLLRLHTNERVPLTPWSTDASGRAAELARELSAHVQGT